MRKDNFSSQADAYAKYRPGYPPELFAFILDKVRGRETAWDCGTGNGQTAKELAQYFQRVEATDISQKQLDNATQAPNITYSLQSAEQTNFPDNSFDLITVSQALHWFRFDEFYAEVKRVAKPGGWLAVWTYTRLPISPEIDELLGNEFYKKIVGEYWDSERKYVDENYMTIPFPLAEIECPRFATDLQWTIEDLAGYIGTWSAVQKFIKARGYDPVPELMQKIRPFWVGERMNIVFPIYLRMGQVSK
jgi:ubiquinone/menaquinone biosynthesis C-methylase UbiE